MRHNLPDYISFMCKNNVMNIHYLCHTVPQISRNYEKIMVCVVFANVPYEYVCNFCTQLITINFYFVRRSYSLAIQ